MVRTRTSTLGAASKFVTGTYVGNGAATQAIVGVGFQPRGLIIWSQEIPNAAVPQYKITQDGAWNMFFVGQLHRVYYDTDQIISLDVDGFTVGDGTSLGANVVNVNLIIYTYIAFG